jgi:apolipoprotein D and lipocalin family protein
MNAQSMKRCLSIFACGWVLAGCSAPSLPPLALADSVDLKRFMGDWYVIASIPTFIERDAYNAIESYALDSDGTIATTFTFNKGAFTGPRKTHTPRGFVLDASSNARWGMRFIWPIKADYRIVHLDAAYTETVIARQARDYVWIMARTPIISEADYARLVQVVAASGYEVSKLRRVPQQEQSR